MTRIPPEHDDAQAEETALSRRERRRIAREERKRYIEKALVVKHVISKSSVTENTCEEGSTRRSSISSDVDEEHEHNSPEEDKSQSGDEKSMRRIKDNLVLSDPDDLEATRHSTQEPWICAICLIPYEVGDEICWSQNPECQHVFHHLCIERWLYKHDECPCCRAAYIISMDSADIDPPSGGCGVPAGILPESPVLAYPAEHPSDDVYDVENPDSRVEIPQQ